ncbi:SDR family oxidoreductase [Tepidibacter hydrothermalis]|uniref:SDR family NAD(P)-dependent oxidoreductase n=1 Tax=Tepidibacter hydrothermalis TaxID=3036126 RepID=A0ABY8E8E0_9FIRM|nr:SDR family NAD(P)-dependent oxidoreductase [Tepidibacter hydrothermalis]WFD09167.1 SDR family NAD(P)-dependent oxidoreductase [Tepidibacter hydrothermalis]
MKKKIVLITGGSSGIGLEMAKQMDKLDYTVLICGRSENKLDLVKKQVPSLHTYVCDVTDSKDRTSLFTKINGQFGQLDMLINNAGSTNRYLFNMEDMEKLERYMDADYEINQKSPILMAKLFQPLLEKSKGTIVNITSGLIYIPLFTKASYCSNKAALHSLTKTLRYQLKDRGIHVQEILYPEVNTPFQQGDVSDRAIMPDEAAALAIKGLMEGKDEIHVKGVESIYKMYRSDPEKAFETFSSSIPNNIEEVLY